ncbi:MAG: ATP-binding protein [Acidobacteriota bacterium]
MIFFTLLSFSSAIIYLYLGVFAYRLNTRAALNRSFFALCMSYAIWAFFYSFLYSAPDKSWAWFWLKISSLGWCTFPAINLHFMLLLSQRKSVLRKKWLFPLLYLPATIFIIKAWTGILTTSDLLHTNMGWVEISAGSQPWMIAFVCYYSSYVVLGLFSTWWWGRHSDDFREKRQARIVTGLGVAALILGTLTNIIIPAMAKHPFPALAASIILIWVFGIWYAISNYELMVLTTEIAAYEIVSRVMDLLILVNPKRKILSINRRTAEMLGFSESELAGSLVEEISTRPQDLRYEVENMIKGDFPHGKVLEMDYRTADGGSVPVNVSGSSIKNKRGEVMGVVVVAQDIRQARQLQQEIAERLEVEEALRRSNEQLKELDTMKTNFLSTVSHELRTPLTSIRGFANMTKKRLNDSILPHTEAIDKKVVKAINQVEQDLDIILSESVRLTTLINDLLDVAKMEAHQVDWKHDPVVVNEIVDQAISATASLFIRSSLEMVKEVPLDLPTVTGDRDRLIQVLINLISNAAKFTSSGKITCSARLTGNTVVISVIDTGIGIAPEDIDKVFEKFKQVGDTLTNKPVGTGLGLSICKEIVEAHRGRIWVESTAGQGSSFSFTLPL